MNNLLLHWSCYVLLIIVSSAPIAQIDQGVLCFWILQVALHSVIPSPCCDARYIISFLFMHNCTYATCIFPCIILSSAYICKPCLPPGMHMWVAKNRIIFGSVLFQMQRLFIRLCSASLFSSHPNIPAMRYQAMWYKLRSCSGVCLSPRWLVPKVAMYDLGAT